MPSKSLKQALFAGLPQVHYPRLVPCDRAEVQIYAIIPIHTAALIEPASLFQLSCAFRKDCLDIVPEKGHMPMLLVLNTKGVFGDKLKNLAEEFCRKLETILRIKMSLNIDTSPKEFDNLRKNFQ